MIYQQVVVMAAADDLLDLTKARPQVLTPTTTYVAAINRLLHPADAVAKTEATLGQLDKLPDGLPLFCGDKSTGLRSHTQRNIISVVGRGMHDAMTMTLGFDMQSSFCFSSPPEPSGGPEGTAAGKKPKKPGVNNPDGLRDPSFNVPSVLPDDFDITAMNELPPCMLEGMEGADASSVLGRLLEVLLSNLVKFFIFSTGVCQQAQSGDRVAEFFEQLILLISVKWQKVPLKKSKTGEMIVQGALPYYRAAGVQKFQNFRAAARQGQVGNPTAPPCACFRGLSASPMHTCT